MIEIRRGDGMPPDVNVSSMRDSSDEMRLQNYRERLKQQNELEIREMEANHAADLERLSTTEMNQIENLRHDYEVRVSQEAETLDEKLTEIRLENAGRVVQGKASGPRRVN